MALRRDYAEKAVRVREKAASISDPELRAHLQRVAEAYDQMTEVAKRVGAARRRVGVARLQAPSQQHAFR